MHEAGIVERGGHKILDTPAVEGKINAADVERICSAWEGDGARDHMIAPALVYISQPTEYGTLYSLQELEELSAVCRERDLKLFVDGARLAYALASPANDVTLADLARLTDQVRLPLRRGRGDPRARLDPPVRHPDEAARRAPGKGAPPGCAV